MFVVVAFALVLPAASCDCCCCGLFDVLRLPPAPAGPKAESPPPPPSSPVAGAPNPVPVPPPGAASPLALASLAAGRIDDVIVQLDEEDPLAVRLTRVLREMRRGADMRSAIWRVYGERWAASPQRSEIVALLAGRDSKVRWRLSALAHADVKTDWPHGTETDAADHIRVELRRALPEGAEDDGPRGYTLLHKLRIARSDKTSALVEGTKMNAYQLAIEAALNDVDNSEIAHYASSVNVLGISEENALKAFLNTQRIQPVAAGLVDELVNHILTDTEVSVKKS